LARDLDHLTHRVPIPNNVQGFVGNASVIQPLDGFVAPATIGFDIEFYGRWLAHKRDVLEGFRDDGVAMFIARSTAAKESQNFISRIPKLVLLAWRNGNRVSYLNLLSVFFDSYLSNAVGDVVNFFRFRMIVLLSGCPDRDAGFS
jgi:hypothetical protein